MKLKNLSKPITIDKNTWCYLEGNKVTVVHEIIDAFGCYEKPIQIKLPLRIIKNWFKRG